MRMNYGYYSAVRTNSAGMKAFLSGNEIIIPIPENWIFSHLEIWKEERGNTRNVPVPLT